MPQNEWYKDWFSSPYYDLLYFKRNEEEAAAFINLLIKNIELKQGDYLLDVACGKGRHSKALSAMGFDVTGIDLSLPSIEEAKAQETDALHFFQHDMRLPFWINYFDAAFNFFTSFGYFRTQREHDDAIRTVSQSLKQNGIFVIDYLNVHFAEMHLVENEIKTSGNTRFHITRRFDEAHFFKDIQIEENGKMQQGIYTEKVAKFSLGDFTEMLAYQGMQVQQVFGDYMLGDYHLTKSPRLIIVSKKINKRI